jgi:hypothetical protein
MTTQYSEWQQSVDGPEELTPEDALSEFMDELLGCYLTAGELAQDLGVSVSTVYRVYRTGRASPATIVAMNKLAQIVLGD